jgi:hypothetical protein
MENEILNFDTLGVDKENDSVRYNDELHKYWVKDSNLACTSVTTLIHKFENFDEEFWSSYKTLEALLTEEQFKQAKPVLLDRKVFNKMYYEPYGITDDEFMEAKKEILLEWARKRDESCVRGTAIHLEHENAHLAGKTKELKKLGLRQKDFKTDISNKIVYGERGVYPELLMSWISPDGKLRVAGQADLIIIDGEDVYVLDYKTNKKIDQKSYFDHKRKKSSKMKYPLNNIDDSNFWHYTLQLSTYAWMIQKVDPRFKIKKLILIHYDHDGGCTEYECEYRQKDVERMLAYYKQKIEHEEFTKSREKITF